MNLSGKTQLEHATQNLTEACRIMAQQRTIIFMLKCIQTPLLDTVEILNSFKSNLEVFEEYER
jgi:hypothetical protein